MNAYYSDGGVVWLVAYGERFMLHGTYSKDAGEHIVQRILTSVDSDRAIAYAEGRKDEAEAPLHLLAELRAVLCGVGIVGQIDGHDVIRRDSVIDLIDRRIEAAALPA